MSQQHVLFNVARGTAFLVLVWATGTKSPAQTSLSYASKSMPQIDDSNSSFSAGNRWNSAVGFHCILV